MPRRSKAELAKIHAAEAEASRRERNDLERALELLRLWTREQKSPASEREATISFKGGHVRVYMTEDPYTRAYADQGDTAPDAPASVEALEAARNALRKLGAEWWL